MRVYSKALLEQSKWKDFVATYEGEEKKGLEKSLHPPPESPYAAPDHLKCNILKAQVEAAFRVGVQKSMGTDMNLPLQKGLPTETEIHQTSQMNLISWDDLGEPMESTQTPEEHHHAQAGQGTNLTPLDSKRQLTHKFLANPIEDDLFNSFGNLPCNEQQSIIDRLDFIRHKLSEIKDSEIQPADMPKASPANLEEQCQNKIRPADPPELQQDDYEIDSSLLFSVYSNKHLLSVADSKSLAEELADVAKQSKTAQPELNKQTKTKTSPATSTRKRTNGCVVEEQFVEEIEMDPSNLEEAMPGHIVPEGSQESGHN
ncbi:UNVERIFIED_CONTAM: hypothetical protein K2H54_055607 [Gekko kuhli]